MFRQQATTAKCHNLTGGGWPSHQRHQVVFGGNGTTTTTTNLSWAASTDNVGVTGYTHIAKRYQYTEPTTGP